MSERSDTVPPSAANERAPKDPVADLQQNPNQPLNQHPPLQYQGQKQQQHHFHALQGGQYSQGHRQNYHGNSGGPGNKGYYNKRNSNYSGKGNTHANPNINANNANANPNMNSNIHPNINNTTGKKQYSPFGFPPMYGSNYYFGYSYQQGIPGMNGIPTGYSPQSAQPFPTSSSVSKVKITDKDCKHGKLETAPKAVEAQGSTHFTPDTSALPASHADAPASAFSASSAGSTTPSPVVSAPAAAGKLSAAEEFKRKILEKAQLVQKKKLDEERAKRESEEKANPPAPVSAPVSQGKSESAQPSASQYDEKTAEKIAEKAMQEPVSETTTSAPSSAGTASVLAVQSLSISTEKPHPKETVEKDELREEITSGDVAVDSQDEAAEEPASPQEDSSFEQHDEAHDDEEEKDHESVPVFDLSLYFERLKSTQPVQDPFSFSYPYPMTGPDARWKAGAKKYRYDPQFLLQFGDFVRYPIDKAWKEKLESLGIVSLKRFPSGAQRMVSNRSGGQQQGQGARFNGSMPNRLGGGQFNDRQNSYSGSRRRGVSNPRDRSLRNRTQSKRGREAEEPPRSAEEPPKPAEDVKPLVPTANRWVPKSRVKKDEVKLAPDGSVLFEPEEIERKINSALNKLTLEMFEPICADMLAIAKQSLWEEDAKTIKQVIALTFAKACDEPYWSSVYAQFCAKMLKEMPAEVKDVTTLGKNGEPDKGGALARRLLLLKCQVEYEKGWVDKLPTNEDGSPLEIEMMSDEYYVMAAAKRRGLGLVKFIGNLYILNMLNDQVILHCMRDQSKNMVDPSEDSLENLAQLIKTVGPRFESTERNKAALSMIYDNIQQILDDCKLPSRIRFMLMDLQDLRKSNWRTAKLEAGPKTIKEIHNEVELKKIEDGRAQAERRRQNRGGYNNSGYGGGNGGDGRSSSSRSGSNWGTKKDLRPPMKDARGFTSVLRSQSNRPGLETRASSSSLGHRELSKRPDSLSGNLFNTLGGANEEEDVDSNAN